MALVERYVEGVKRLRYVIIIFWAMCIALGLWQGLKLLSNTAISLEAPSGSASAIAGDLYKAAFPSLADNTPLTVVIQRNLCNNSSCSILGKDTKLYLEAVANATFAYPGGYLTPQNFASYYILAARGLTVLAKELVRGNVMLAVMNVHVSGSGVSAGDKDFVTFVDNTVHDMAAKMFPAGSVSVWLTGDLVFGRDVQEGTEHDLLIMDGAAFPVALFILALVLRSLRLLMIPILCIATSILTSFTLVYPISLSYMTVSFTPSLMMSSTIAMSIDYSLFLLSRYREELLGMRPSDVAVVHTLRTSGHTVLVSGTTLALCFAGLAFFQVMMLSIPGLATAIAISVAVLVNLTLTPALLLTFPVFFANSVRPFRWPWQSASAFGDASTPLLHLHSGMQQLSVLPDTMALRKSYWFRMGRFVTRYSWLVVAIVIGLAVPCAIRAVDFDRTMSIMAFTPRDSEATKAYNLLAEKFGTGLLFPYQLVATPPPGMGLISAPFYNATIDLLQNRLLPLPAHSVSFVGIMAMGTEFISYDIASFCADTCIGLCQSFCEAKQQYISADNLTTYIDIHLDFGADADPFGAAGKAWLEQARAVLNEAQNEYGITFSLANGAAPEFDIIDKVYGVFPTAIGVTLAVVFVLTGLAFRSLVVPARAVLSITLTLAYVYACAVWVFQSGALNFLSLTSLSGQGALSWIAPVMAFSVLVGLGLDYDIFLLTRVREYRDMGVADPGTKEEVNNVLMGLTLTGGVITAAGLIMAVAFVGLLFSTETVLNELSFFLVFAVLFDTLVVRTILVPALMTLLGRWNWWPSRQPMHGSSAFASSSSIQSSKRTFT